MSALARRKWSEINTEAILAAGGHNYTGYSTRMKYWLCEAYFSICALYHHYELDGVYDFALPAGSCSIDLPDDFYITTAVYELDANNQPKKVLMPRRPAVMLGGMRLTMAAQPTYYTRLGTALLFDAKPAADTRYRMNYYRRPAAPDFDATTGTTAYPETSRLWDAPIIDAGVARAKRRIWRPDLSAFDAQALGEWLDSQPQAQTLDEPVTTIPDKPATGKPLGGAQG